MKETAKVFSRFQSWKNDKKKSLLIRQSFIQILYKEPPQLIRRFIPMIHLGVGQELPPQPRQLLRVYLVEEPCLQLAAGVVQELHLAVYL